MVLKSELEIRQKRAEFDKEIVDDSRQHSTDYYNAAFQILNWILED